MKTKITLFATVLAAALFVGGCASTKEILREPVVNQANLESKNGLMFLKGEDQPFTGTVREYEGGRVSKEYQAKAGLYHGYYKEWHMGTPKGGLAGHRKYENGKITFYKWWTNGQQVELGGFNSDGSRKR